MKFKYLCLPLLVLLIVFINNGVSHPPSGHYDFVPLPNGGAYTFETSNDYYDPINHKTVKSYSSVSISVHFNKERNEWSVYVSAYTSVTAKEYTRWDGLNPVVIWPHGTYKLSANIYKKDNQGVFRHLKSGNNNTRFATTYTGGMTASSYAFYHATSSEPIDIWDYRATASSEITNVNEDPDESASTSASRN